MPYQVKITERLVRVITVEAETPEDAVDNVRQQYRNSQIILLSDDFVDVDFSIIGDE